MSTNAVPPKRLLLVAHAATTASRRAAFPTGAEPLEDDTGTALLALRPRLASATGLVAPSSAARRTAELLGLAATQDPALRDLDLGTWAGGALDAVSAEQLGAWRVDPRFAGHGGESLVGLVARVEASLDAQLTGRGVVVAVTHAAVLRAAALAVLRAPASSFWTIDAPPLAALTLHSDGRRWVLRGLGPLAAALSSSAAPSRPPAPSSSAR